ncbi:MAG: hypothetical protein HRU04_10520 [Oceanospirillaceae bacterium]|nr:hypothetical protein [Oceanospirillaceae bacterium]
MHQVNDTASNVGSSALSAWAPQMKLASKAGNFYPMQENIDQGFDSFKVAMKQALS